MIKDVKKYWKNVHWSHERRQRLLSGNFLDQSKFVKIVNFVKLRERWKNVSRGTFIGLSLIRLSVSLQPTIELFLSRATPAVQQFVMDVSMVLSWADSIVPKRIIPVSIQECRTTSTGLKKL